MECDLIAQTSSPIAVSVTSPNSQFVSWQGVAGVTPVPEPGSAASLVAVRGAIVAVVRRWVRVRRRD